MAMIVGGMVFRLGVLPAALMLSGVRAATACEDLVSAAEKYTRIVCDAVEHGACENIASALTSTSEMAGIQGPP